MVGADRASGGQGDDAAKFFGRFRSLAEQLARQEFRENWKKDQNNQMAAALQVAASTVGRWLNGDSFPRRRYVEAALTRAKATDIETKELLELWESADRLRKASRLRRKTGV